MQQYQRALKLILRPIDVVSQVAAKFKLQIERILFVCNGLNKILSFLHF